MIHLKLTRRFINRLAVCLALFAPIVYLFGSQFATLAGAHGEELLAETTEVTPSYDELMTPENFSYGAFDWVNEHGTRLGFSLGHLYVPAGASSSWLYLQYYGVASDSTSSGVRDYGLGFSGEDGPYAFLSFYYSLEDKELYLEDWDYDELTKFYGAFYAVSDDLETVYAFTFGYDSVLEESFNDSYYLLDGEWDTGASFTYINENQWKFYFDDGAHLPVGVEWNDELRSYFVPTVKPVETTSYRNALFGNMFGKSNFLIDWGRNVLSDNPIGFAPIATFFKAVDSWSFHLGESPAGLMAYGYLYWCAHVLIFDLMFYCTTFVYTFIFYLMDKFGGEKL